MPRLLSDIGKVGEKGVGALGGQLAVDADSFVSSLERLLAPPEVAQHGAEVV